jgi:hypothetical protein
METDKAPQLWCWIDGNWAAVRIYSYYAPIWICIFLALVIYIRVGVEIYQKRSELRAAAYSNNYTSGTLTSISDNPRAAPFTGIRTTEVEVTHDAWNKNPLSPPPQGYARGEKVESRKDQYSITISAPTTKIQSATRFKKPVGTSMDKVKGGASFCNFHPHYLGTGIYQSGLWTQVPEESVFCSQCWLRVSPSSSRVLEHGYIFQHQSWGLQKCLGRVERYEKQKGS